MHASHLFLSLVCRSLARLSVWRARVGRVVCRAGGGGAGGAMGGGRFVVLQKISRAAPRRRRTALDGPPRDETRETKVGAAERSAQAHRHRRHTSRPTIVRALRHTLYTVSVVFSVCVVCVAASCDRVGRCGAANGPREIWHVTVTRRDGTPCANEEATTQGSEHMSVNSHVTSHVV